MAVVAVDVGGTKVAAARVAENGEILECTVLPTRAAEGFAASFAQIEQAIRACFHEGVPAIGICAPGPLNPKTGVVLNPPNLPGWRNVPLAEEVSRRFGVRCRVENDSNAAGLAEAHFGAGRGYATVFCATLGTGIGTGIILNGKIHYGKNGLAGEGGHLTMDYRSPVHCNCGLPGCIEALASGSAIARRAGLPAEAVARAAAEGDAAALAALEEAALVLGAWLGGIINLLDPDIIVLGGGVAQIGEPLFSRLRRIVPERSINQFAAQTPIVPAQLGTNAGLVGAAAVVMEP